MGKNLEKFLLLTWKNWLLQWRARIQTLFEILLPVLFSVLLVLMRSLGNVVTEPDKLFPSFSLDSYAPDINLTTIAWSPCDNAALQNIMVGVSAALSLGEECYNDSRALESNLWDNMHNILAGVQFSDSLTGRNDLDESLSVELRFSSEMRNWNGNWMTNLIFPVYQLAGPREPGSDTGAEPSYFNQGFLTLQYHISREIIKFHADDVMPEVLMQRFSYPSWINDPMQVVMQNVVGLIFMLGFISTCVNTVRVITIEKEKQLKEAMKIMGLPNWLHWTAWFLKIFMLLLVSIILMIVILKVNWFPGSSVFSLTNPFVLFLFLILFACTTITFCFAISVFFSKANTATTLAGLLWAISYFIYNFVQQQYDTTSLAEKMLVCLASNSAMAYGFQLILMWEGTGEGVGWSNLFSPVTPDDNFTLGHVMVMLVVDSIIYLLIALYVEAVFPGDYGVPQVWYYPFTRNYWYGTENYEAVSELNNLESDVYEQEPTNLKIGIQINKLNKIYPGEKVAVQDLSFNMFENQVTVLLGHNGAGKTTTMSILTGMITPTNGTAIINGFDIRTNMSRVRESLGFCPQHNILFDSLTVAEHIYFFSKLKGLSKTEIDREIKTYIELLDLVEKEHSIASTLSGGMKRKLSVAVAMCGNSKICILDEPTAGMDPTARKALTDLIVKQKKDRTILLSTHYMDEADLLGDRIAIMAEGELKCYGSTFFLKKKYGAGYHLVMEKDKHCDVNRVTGLLKMHIPSIKLETNVGAELSYILAENQSAIFEKMLSELENNSKDLGINSYGISLTTMEEVFMRVGTDRTAEEMNPDNKLESIPLMLNNSTSTDSIVNMTEKEFVTGWSLWKNQFLAILIKRVYTAYRNWNPLLVQNLIPIGLLILIFLQGSVISNSELPSLAVSLNPFDDAISVVTTEQSTDQYYMQYLKILNSENRQILDWKTENMTEKIISETIENTSKVTMRYIIGASFDENLIIAWFNNNPYHSPPITLQYCMNAVLQGKTDSNHLIQFVNSPLPYSTDTKLDPGTIMGGLGFLASFYLAFCMAFVTPFYVIFLINERSIKSKHLQFVSGVSISSFWVTTAIWDFITFLITIICIIITIVCFQEDGFRTAADLGRVFVIFLFFMMASLPLTYLASFVFDTPTNGFKMLALFNVLLGPVLFMILEVLSMIMNGGLGPLPYILSLLPHYCVAAALMAVNNKYNLIELCQQIADNNMSPCETQSSCCDLNKDYFNFDDGIGLNLILMVITGVLATVTLLLVEYRIFHAAIYSCQKKKAEVPLPTEDTDDSDVLEEKRKIREGEITPDQYEIVLKDLSKYYDKFLAVNQISLGIKGYECFGLLGINGAGKTTTFKMMTGDVVISSGEAWIRNYNLKTHMKEVYKNIGYCPQFDALLDDLTGKETIVMFCLLRGILYADSLYIAEQLARDFDFYRHLNKCVKHYSGGNKRKLSAAVALIGDPAIVFLDEPSAGMDPATKRHLWNTLCKIRDNGKCLVLTSHSMEECEALCTRLVIMVNGVFKCLGSTQHLKNKFSEGYMLIVKIRKLPDLASESEQESPVGVWIQNNFPNAVLKEKHQELLTYFIPGMSQSWAKMFAIMERGKREVSDLEDYSLGQSNLEQIFLLFSKQQRAAE